MKAKCLVIFSISLVMAGLAGYGYHDSHFDRRVKYKLGYQSEEMDFFYEKMVGTQLRMDLQVNQGATTMIGDSHTQGIIYPRFLNYGIGSDTSLGVLNRIEKYDSLKTAKHIILMVGVNDLRRRSDSEILRNYNEILERFPSNKFIIFSILPVSKTLESKNPEINNLRIKRLNKSISDLCLKRSVRFINIFPEYLDNQGYLDDKFHVGDGLHLNKIGYAIWIKHLDLL